MRINRNSLVMLRNYMDRQTVKSIDANSNQKELNNKLNKKDYKYDNNSIPLIVDKIINNNTIINKKITSNTIRIIDLFNENEGLIDWLNQLLLRIK